MLRSTMILPRHWDALAATLNVVDLEGSPEEAWRFLVYRGFAVDTPEGARRFMDVVNESLSEQESPVGAVGPLLRRMAHERGQDTRHPADPEGHVSRRLWRLWQRRNTSATPRAA
ncbi:hypothetical protein LZ198_25745 [Myxococcus sp. K15C18031901]|uniref:hypothetical protein n=1 Tax=Myxococcus dinghuensis TaxID=2906761 RepID=UPI0020A7DDC3|nr:hypothetical protein [Myxococcus dinghuensis]MCP3102278.1 hypothetical protein [Myxococcus dinghuensis]